VVVVARFIRLFFLFFEGGGGTDSSRNYNNSQTVASDNYRKSFSFLFFSLSFYGMDGTRGEKRKNEGNNNTTTTTATFKTDFYLFFFSTFNLNIF